MVTTTITLHTKFQIGQVDPRIFGGFLEHIGRAVYEGVYDPDCSYADEDGFRTDVMEAMRRLGMTAMRYPGGNFVSGYHWMDGVGPRDQRPTVRELAWQSLEPNHFGTDEFIKLSRKMDRYSKRFDLIYVDYQTQRCVLKTSAHWYRRVIAANAVVD